MLAFEQTSSWSARRATAGMVDLSRRVALEVAVLDYNMPGNKRPELIKELRQRIPGRGS